MYQQVWQAWYNHIISSITTIFPWRMKWQQCWRKKDAWPDHSHHGVPSHDLRGSHGQVGSRLRDAVNVTGWPYWDRRDLGIWRSPMIPKWCGNLVLQHIDPWEIHMNERTPNGATNSGWFDLFCQQIIWLVLLAWSMGQDSVLLLSIPKKYKLYCTCWYTHPSMLGMIGIDTQPYGFLFKYHGLPSFPTTMIKH